jgi:hypothetical protein
MVAPVVPSAVAPTTRIWLAFACFFRILIDGAFAARVFSARRASPALAEEPEVVPAEKPAKASPRASAPANSALVLLALLQREGRLVDFVQQDIDGFADEEIGAAARVLHAGCREALRRHATIAPIRSEEEDSRVEVEDGIESGAVKLVGAVGGEPPYRGILRHRGWRVTLSLPQPTTGHDAAVVAPAEVEL